MSTAQVMHSEPPSGQLPTARIQEIFVRVLDTEIPSEDTDLIETGILDSLALVSLILEIESEFGLSVSFDELEIEHFRTLTSIAEFVTSGQEAGA